MKLNNKEIIISNKLTSDLSNFISEHELGQLNKESIINYVSAILQSCEIKDEIIFKVFEEFGTEGKNEILAIKINKGY